MSKIEDFLNKNLDKSSKNKLKAILKKNQKRTIGKIEKGVEKIFDFLIAPFNCLLLGLILIASLGYIIYPHNKTAANLTGLGLYIFLLFILYPTLLSIKIR